jgi:hypothetical protein
MVLTKEELIAALQDEVRILVHLTGKVDPAEVDYRPTAKQRSTLELLQYLAIMGPTLLTVFKTGKFDRETLSAIFGPAVAKSKTMNLQEASAAIQEQSGEYTRLLADWTDADFRAAIDVFGRKTTRGAMIVNLVLGGHAAYRTQLFCYLKACGREELNTMNLWSGVDTPA